MEIRLNKTDIIWSYIGTLMSMGANMIMLPVIIYYLDADMLGLWYIFISIGAIAVLFDFGFGVTFARNITYCWSGAGELHESGVSFVGNREPDYALMNRVLQACKLVYLRLSVAALFLMLTVGMAYVMYVSRDVEGYTHLIAWLIYAVAVFLNLYFGYYASFLRGVGAIDAANKNTVIARTAQIIVTVILLALGFGIIGACIAYLTYGTLFRVLGKWKFLRYQHIGEHLKQVKDKVTKTEVKPLIGVVWYNAWRDGLISVSNYMSNQATVIICSLFLTLSETGIYSVGVQIAMAIATISGTFYMASQPQLQAAYINQDHQRVRSTMSLIVVTLIYLFMIGGLGVFAMILPLLKWFKPEAIVSMPIFLGLLTYHFILKFRDCFGSYFSCTNRIIYLRSYILSAFFCIVLSVLFTGCLHWGIWGLIIAQMISQLVYNVWHWPMLSMREMGLSLSDMFRIGNRQLQKQVCKVISNKS